MPTARPASTVKSFTRDRAGRGSRALCCAAALALAPGAASRAQVVINEILAENDLTCTDETGDHEDWVELLNTGSSDMSLEGYKLTDDPSEPTRWTFPAISVPAHGRLLVWLSGHDRLVPPPVVDPNKALIAFRPLLVRRGDVWRYLVGDPTASGPPAGWTLPEFNDEEWPSGPSGFGFADGDDATVIPAAASSVFIRREFVVEDPTRLENLYLRIDFDDGFVAFVNGVRVTSDGFGGEEPTFQSTASAKREAGEPQLHDLSAFRGLLVPGRNVIAVAGLNNLASNDMSLIPELGWVPSYLHASFKLEKDGESLMLSGPSGAVVDQIDFGIQTSDHSFGRYPDGGASWSYYVTPTPGTPNDGPASAAVISDRVVLTPEAARFGGPIQVSMSLSPASPAVIRFTTDGSTPTAASAAFNRPLRIVANTAITAAGFLDGVRVTLPVSKSYFVGGDIGLPVISLSMDPADYLAVHDGDDSRGIISEKPARLEYLDERGVEVASAPMGLRLHGGASRGGGMETKKSYRCYFRGEYGAKKLLYPIIRDALTASFDALVLRSGFNDAFRTNSRASYLRDQLTRDLHGDLGGIISHGGWCDLFVNMRPRGLYNVVEHIDENLLKAYTGDKDWDIIKTGTEVVAGTLEEWDRLHAFVLSNDLAQETNLAQVESLVDLDDLTAYMLVNIWAQNHDWISNNWYTARPRRPDGKWIFLTWDAEFALGLIPPGFTADTFEFIFTRAGSLRDLFEALLRSQRYRARFAEAADRYFYGPLRPERVVARIEAIRDRIAPDIPEEIEPYGQPVSRWQANVEECLAFARGRGPYFLGSIFGSSRFSFPAVTTPRVFACTPSSVVNLGGTEVVVSGVRLDETTRVQVGGLEADAAALPDGTLRVTLPFELKIEGSPSIAVTNPATGESSKAEGLLEVIVPRPRPASMDPRRGSRAGGDVVRIVGEGFLEGVTVDFGDAPATSVVLHPGSPAVIEAVTPPGNGFAIVLVVNHVPGGPVPAHAALDFEYVTQNFIRGDVNGDGELNIADPIAFLSRLFLGTGPIPCLDAADSNDSGRIDLSDAVYSLSYMFYGGRPPRPPFPTCGPDPTSDMISCDDPLGCR